MNITILDDASGQGLLEFLNLGWANFLAPMQIEVSQLRETAQGRNVADLFQSSEAQNSELGQITQRSNIAHSLAIIKNKDTQFSEVFQR